MISVWEFDKAPQEYKNLSQNGGDEDWVVLIPKADQTHYYIPWLDRIDSCNEPQEFTLPNGDKLYIGAHA